MKHRVYANLPKTGLGNMLLVWARAKVFSYVNEVPLTTSSWWGIRLGAWIRNENNKRLYLGYFHECSPWKRLTIWFRKRLMPIVYEPPVRKYELPENPVIFHYSCPVTQNDLFTCIKPYRTYIKEEIFKLIKPKLRKQLNGFHIPEIAVHIRRGDFRYGSTITPNSFFIQCIHFIRSATGVDLSVTVFTDGEKEEIADILQLENVSLAEAKADILDILQMSRSRVIVLSQTSTFSYWAAFLSDAIVIKPWGDWYGDIRPEDVNRDHFEGCISFEKSESLSLLRKSLQKLN